MLQQEKPANPPQKVHRRELGRAFDLRDPAEREAFEAAGAHEDKCTGVVARAARWAVEIIGQEQVRDALQAVMASQLEG